MIGTGPVGVGAGAIGDSGGAATSASVGVAVSPLESGVEDLVSTGGSIVGVAVANGIGVHVGVGCGVTVVVRPFA